MLYAVVPVKTLVRAKSRLSPALSFAQRLHLARRFLRDTLALLNQYPGACRTIVVSADQSVLRLARTKGMIALPQTARGGINRAVTLGCALAKRRGAGSVVVIPTDLPHLTVGTLRDFARPASRPTIRIAPDRHGAGTNALYLQPVRPGFARFGEQSLKRHRTVAQVSGRDAQLVRTDMLAFDVDVPADLLRPVS
ncbi:MAG: cofC [Alphaproteobacteria bacterium]|nr:cofC [Alphaproteobacteria bacterium]